MTSSKSRIPKSIVTALTATAVAAGLIGAVDDAPSAAASPEAGADRDYVSLVNPWIEADIGRFFFFQSASNPFGMVKLRPDTTTHHARNTGYRKNEDEVKGFSHLHDWQLSGVQVMPTSGEPAPKLEGDTGWESHVEHDDSELAQPGYHRLHLDRYDIDAELTTTDRVGMHRYTYGQDGAGEIIVNLGGVLGEAEMEDAHVTRVSDHELAGYVNQHGERYPGRHETTLYFNIQFDTAFDAMHGWADGALIDDGGAVDEVEGPDAGVYVSYDDLEAGDEVQMKVALSLTGEDGARRNLEAEAPGWDFEAVKSASQNRWNEMLGRIDVAGGTDEQQQKFYTDLFHVLCGRSMVSDADGAYMDDTWNNGQVRQIPTDSSGEPEFAMYNYDALWLTQWNLNSVLGMAYPEIYSSLVRSQLQTYDDGDLLPRAPVAGNYSMVMTGSPITSFISGAWNKGIRDFDIDKAFEAMLDAQSLGGLYDKASSDYLNWGTGGNRSYLDLGYVASEETGESAGQTLEYAHQDWVLGQLAEQLDARGINAAQFAAVTASSQLDDDAHSAERAVDGRPQRAPTDVEWRSDGEQNPWIELSWDEPRTVDRIVLNDVADPDSSIRAGELRFSDGSSVAVDGIPADGGDKEVTVSARTVDSVRFVATGGEGDDVGLGEFEVWDDTDLGEYLTERSQNWRNVFDEEVGFARPRSADGTWREDFDPLSSSGFNQANSWQSTWFTTHDVMGLANLMGGEAAYADKLNYAFRRAEPGQYIGGYGETTISYGNQPDLQAAHLFNYVGHPWLTQYWVREIKDVVYGSTATDDGYGHHDEDQGQMGALSALMAIGLFEVTGAGLEEPVYDITSPVFDEITISLDDDYYDGDEFRIVTHDNSAENLYIQGAELNGERWDKAWFPHDDLVSGGTLELWMGSEPNTDWGVDELPPSESESAGEHPVLADEITVTGPDRIVEPYASASYEASIQPEDTALKEVFWSVTEPDGSATDKATIDPFSGALSVNHRDGQVRVTATAADSGEEASSIDVEIALDDDLLRGNAAQWPGASVTASSEYSSGYAAGKAVDGVIGDPNGGDWASAGEKNPWIRLEWSEPIEADRIVLYDRAREDDANGGTLTFGDGTSIAVEDIPRDGAAHTVSFDAKTFDEVTFQVEGGSGPNVGLSEFEVYAMPDVPDAPQQVTATAAPGGATVSWEPPEFDGGVPVTGYIVTPYVGEEALDAVEVGEDEAEATVTDLSAGETYRFTVTAKNLSGTGEESGLSDPVRIEEPEAPEWDPDAEYGAGDTVSYEGAVYVAQWWTTEVPGASATGSWMEQGVVTACEEGDVAAWTASQVYTGGEHVVHDGDVFEATWWTRNQEPGDPHGPWAPVGSC